MVTPQQWLNNQEKYKNKQKVEMIDLANLEVDEEGKLEIKDFPNLKEIKKDKENISKISKIVINGCQQLEAVYLNSFKDNKELTITKCLNLKTLNCSDNQLTNLEVDNPAELRALDLTNNNFPATQNLEFLAKFTNLRVLALGNHDGERIKRGRCNYFSGTLEPLKGMTKLEWLDISNTDLKERGGVFPISLRIFCSSRTVIQSKEEANLTQLQLETKIKDLLDLDENDKLPDKWDELLVKKSDTISFFSMMKELEKARNFLEEYGLLMEKEKRSWEEAIKKETDQEKIQEYEKEREEYEAQIEQVDSLIDKF